MAKRRRQAKIPTLAWERPRGAIGSRVLGRGFQFYGAVVIGLLMAVGLGVIAYAFLADELEERSRPGSTAIQVEDTRFRLDYFSSRLTMFVNQNGGQATDVGQRATAVSAVSELLIREEIVRRFAGEFDLTASEEEIQEGIASRLGISVDDETFEVVFEQELARSGLSEEDYRLMVQATVLADKLTEHFRGEAPESAESVLYRQILVSEQEKADELVSDLQGGADFAALAAEDFNLDVANRENGGDVGWVPRGVQAAPLDASTEALVFDLEPGDISKIEFSSSTSQGEILAWLVVEMLEKDDDRSVEDDQKGTLADRDFNDWVQEKQEPLSIVNNMDGSDPDKFEWAIDSARG